MGLNNTTGGGLSNSGASDFLENCGYRSYVDCYGEIISQFQDNFGII